MTEIESLKAALPPQLQKITEAGAPAAQKMMAAKGIVPTSPRNLVCLLTILAHDQDQTLAKTALESLGRVPDTIKNSAVDSADLPDMALDTLARANEQSEPLLEKILLHANVAGETVERLAALVSERLATIISDNQRLFMEHPAIAISLAKNTHARRASIDGVFDFLVRSGIVVEAPEYFEALHRLTPADQKAALDKLVLPEELAAAGLLEDTPAESSSSGAPVPTDEEVAARPPTIKLIGSLNAAQKIALALKGNREARSVLIRDSNRMIASAVIRSPRITEPEIAYAAQSRQVSDEVIRIIAQTRDMCRSYAVKVALCNNPKTPLPASMRLVHDLRKSDLKLLARSKNIASGLATLAKQLAGEK
jgi:hypothetical protein